MLSSINILESRMPDDTSLRRSNRILTRRILLETAIVSRFSDWQIAIVPRMRFGSESWQIHLNPHAASKPKQRP
ncbi:unnamed protein product [Protopolystoma xenopodis]|uniref:Uncharacterized protein n=1 Tax=Protopolystoma xenopodis TaxID=117903 RepID=A0A3S5CK32_9PLAT|nr:unnamed protein product [Protopolystoma xenopodis]